jgi:cell division protein FtsW
MFMQRNVAYMLLIVMLGLIALGLVMLSSTSAVLAPSASDMNGVYSNLRKQCVWLALGGVTCAFFALCDYQKILRLAPWIVGVACVLLALCLVPHIGAKINGSPRWLRVDGWTYQPSEFAKLAPILFLSWWMGKNQRHARELKRGLVLPVLCTLPVLALMVVQQDFGTTAIMMIIMIAILFVAGSRTIYLLPLPILGFTGLVIHVISNHERWGRIAAWWDFFTHPEHVAANSRFWQQLQGLIALGSATAARKCTGCPR